MVNKLFIRIELRGHNIIRIFWKREDRTFKLFSLCLPYFQQHRTRVSLEFISITSEAMLIFFLAFWKHSRNLTSLLWMSISQATLILKQNQWILCNQNLSAGRIPAPAIEVPSQPEPQIVQQLCHLLSLMMCRHPSLVQPNTTLHGKEVLSV